MKKALRILTLALAFAGCFTLFALADVATGASFAVFVALPVLGRRKPLEIICVAVGTTGILVLAFGGFFQILLP